MMWFDGVGSLVKGKVRYRELLLQHHPDVAGSAGEEITKEIIAQWKDFLIRASDETFRRAKMERDPEMRMAAFDEESIKDHVWRPFIYLGATLAKRGRL